jgi:hypothetical protein
LYAFAVAVLGDEGVMPAEELSRLLDYLVNRQVGQRRVTLLTAGGSPGADWARSRAYGITLVPGGANPVKQDCELTAHADAVVILGDPAPWRRLIRLCEEAGVPVRVYRGRLKSPPAFTPAWELPPPVEGSG